MPLFSPTPTSLCTRRERRHQLAAALAGTVLAISCASALLSAGTHNALAEGDVPIISEQPGASGGEQGGIIVNPLPNNPQPEPDPTPAPSPAPTLIASRADIPALAPGQQAEVEVTFENTGDTALIQPVTSFSTSSGLVLVGNSSTLALPDIEPHGKQTVKITVAALDGSANAAQSLGVETRFNYVRDGALTQASATDSVPIPCAAATPGTGDNPDQGGTGDGGATPGDGSGDGSGDGGGDWGGDWGGGWGDGGTSVPDFSDGMGGSAQQTTTAGTPDKPVPNVIVSNFSYGDGTGAVAAGSTFPLTFAFTNTSTSLTVENLVVSVDTGDQFTINGGTNTFYSAYLGAGELQQQTLNLKAISGDKAVPGTVTIGFKYEYVENNERKSANTEVKLTVPVFQPDRFELANPIAPDYASVGEEATVTVSYVNKGKSAVSNVAVSISGEGIHTETPAQNVGNLESGKSGTIGLAFTPTQGGTLNLTLTVEYENANDDTVTKTFPLQVDVMDDPYANMSDEELQALFGGGMDDGFEGDGAQQGLPVPAIIGIAIAALAAVTLIVVAVRRGAKKRKASQRWDDDDDWGDWGMTVPPLNEHVPVIPRGQDTIVRGVGQSRVPGELGQADGSQSHVQGTGAPSTNSSSGNDPSGAPSHMRP